MGKTVAAGGVGVARRWPLAALPLTAGGRLIDGGKADIFPAESVPVQRRHAGGGRDG